MNHFIVGDVTIDLARMIERALSKQILIGNFYNYIDEESAPLNTVQFMGHAKKRFAKFENITLSREKILAVKIYLTGEKSGDDEFKISRYVISDKHDYKHVVFNAKANIYRQRGAPVFLGRQACDLENFKTVTRAAIEQSMASSSVFEFPLKRRTGATLKN